MSKLKDIEKVSILISLVLVSLLAFYVDKKQVIKKAYDSLETKHQEKIDIEYGASFNALDYIDKKDDIEIISDVDTKKVGTYDIKYLLKTMTSKYNREVVREYDSKVNVIDSKYPIIELEKEEVSTYLNNEYDINTENILRVYDEVDGDLEYEVSSDVDISTVGEYEVTIKAKDNNNLETSKSYKLIVKRKPNVYMGGNYSYIYDYLINLGYNKAATCGILANIKFESTFNPGVDTGTYYGLCQWGGGRRSNLFAWCESNGLDPYSVDGQLQYMQHELTTSYTGAYNSLISCDDSADGAYNAAVAFCNKFEGAATSAGRGELAYSYYEN